MLIEGQGQMPAILSVVTTGEAVLLGIGVAIVVGMSVWFDDWHHHRTHHDGDYSQPCDGDCGRTIR